MTVVRRTSTRVEVRRRATADADTVVEVLWRVHRTDGYPAAWPTDPWPWLTPVALVDAWLAVDRAGAVLGHVALVLPAVGWMPELTRLFVDPAARGLGVGDALLDVAEHAAAAAYPGGGGHLRLDVTEDSPAAWRLYERRGFRLTGRGPADWAKPSGEVPTMRYYAKRLP